MTGEFFITDPSTWPDVLSLEEVALIYRRTPEGLRYSLRPSAKKPFSPQPFLRHPARWRKADVLRDVQGARVAAPFQRSA